HRILYWNRGAERLYGWSSEEVLGQDANELLYAEPLSNLPEMQRELEATGEWQGELNQMTKAGQPIVVNSRWTLVRQEGKLPSILVVNTDVTEKKQLEAQFLRAQRLESLGTLAGGIAHDFNNILTPILGFAQLLPKKLSLDPQAQNVFKIIETNARRGKDLIQQVLTFARGLEGDRGPVQVRHLIADIKKIATETFPKNIDIQTSVSNLHTVEGDATQLHQVLMNFAVNARDAMPQGGILRITAENFTIDANDARFHREAQEGTYVLIAVTDTGVGISADNLEHIFEPFFTTKEVGYGTGLGLSTAIGIVRSHGGFVEVSSEVDRGTQFNVFLPASTSAESIPATPPELPQGKGELILVVDDEAPIQEMTRAALETYGYRVLTASDGVEAIALFAQHQEQIQVVLLDLNMPVLGGYTTVSILQKIKPAVKIIIMSGLPTSREGGSALRTATTLAKPYTTEELLKKVADVVRSPSDFPKL
ncbi:MAG: ATP-binding protein, partial [Cyanophyceae cyanobacterium]